MLGLSNFHSLIDVSMNVINHPTENCYEHEVIIRSEEEYTSNTTRSTKISSNFSSASPQCPCLCRSGKIYDGCAFVVIREISCFDISLSIQAMNRCLNKTNGLSSHNLQKHKIRYCCTFFITIDIDSGDLALGTESVIMRMKRMHGARRVQECAI